MAADPQEQVLLVVHDIFRWKGPRKGMTTLTATRGWLALTSRRLVFEGGTGRVDVPLPSVTACEVTGRRGNLTVSSVDAGGRALHLTFGTQQLGFPNAQEWAGACLAARDDAGVPGQDPPAPDVTAPDVTAPDVPGQATSGHSQTGPDRVWTRDAAMAFVAGLRRRTWGGPITGTELSEALRGCARAVEAIAPGDRAIAALDRAADRPDVGALTDAADLLSAKGLPEVAASAVRTALSAVEDDRPQALVDMLVDALDAAERPVEALEVYREHPWAVLPSATRARVATVALRGGDVDMAREAFAGAPPDPDDADPRHAVAARCLARAGATALDPRTAGVREWSAVLDGSVLLHESEFGEEEMRGRYAMVWDRHDRCGGLLASLLGVLEVTGRTPQVVATAGDRSSLILGHAVADVLGLAPPVSLDEAERLLLDPAHEPGLVLYIAYEWSGLPGGREDTLAMSSQTVLFGYCVPWTRRADPAPDVAGLQAQTIVPGWGGGMRLAPAGDEAVNVGPDTRGEDVLGAELAAATRAWLSAPPPQHGPEEDPDDGDEARHVTDARRVAAVVSGLCAVPWAVGLLSGGREAYRPGNPVGSARFS